MGMARALKKEGLIYKEIQSFKSKVKVVVSQNSVPITIWKEQLESISPVCKQHQRKEATRREAMKLSNATNKQLSF